MIGEVIDGRYEIEDLVGTGGMSSVYRARDAVLGRRVAIKILHEHFSSDDEYVERFRREARAIARLNHPNIVTVIDRGEFGGRQFIVFEHVPGDNLKDAVRRQGPLPVADAVVIAHQVARALAFAHENGIVHRDVKPQNVLLDESGAPKVTDFGIARSIDPKDGLTETGTLLGTSDYMAPEQARGMRVDERSDQYSLGVLLYELLTGEVPYPAESFMAAAMRHLHDPVPSVRERRPDVPVDVDAIVARAMAKNPRDRFSSAAAMAAALEACLGDADGATGVLPAASSRRASPRPGRRRRPLSPLLLGLGVLAAGAIAVFLLVDRSDGNGGEVGNVRLTALRDFDPEGDDAEHPDEVSLATDGNPETFWTTETYEAFSKSGVGIILDAGRQVGLDRIEVVTDEPGFTAEIQGGNNPDGGFTPFSETQEVGARTVFELAGGASYRYYLLWITDPNTRAHVNEIRAG